MIRRAEGHDEAEMGSIYAREENQKQSIQKLNIIPLENKKDNFIFLTYFYYPRMEKSKPQHITKSLDETRIEIQ